MATPDRGHSDPACSSATATTGSRPVVMALIPPQMSSLFPSDILQSLDCDMRQASSITDAQFLTEGQRSDLAIVPLDVNGCSTLPLIRDLMKHDPDQAIVVVSQSDQINDAAEAMRIGALDCIFVPFTPDRLKKTITQALCKSIAERSDTTASTDVSSPPARPITLQSTHKETPNPDDAHPIRHGMVLSDLSMKPVLHALDTIAASNAPIYIQGETGTGKELLARAFHAESQRASGPFIVVDCARLAPDTLAQQLFASSRGPGGAASAADGGTLFLDGITRMDLQVQNQLMRFLESGDLSPLGSHDATRVDARIICASSEDAQTEIEAGRLRGDLYYRLHVVPITLPALRDRGEDILAIANTKLVQMARREGRRFRGFTPDAVDVLQAHPWPGNVRQLINVIWNIVLHHDGEIVTTEMLPDDLLAGLSVPRISSEPAGPLDQMGLLGRPLAEIERIVIEETIRMQGGSIPRAAQVLQVSPSTLYRKRESWSHR
ncbi:sigma-54 dependent transcriptional regulator [Aliiroseovarius sp. S2029]|uniref:sigma-54-dependent transcriptional regulator n=1 Tax=Aliiroseovarius sp. S2029 TaxID=2936988 RepID=UPI0020C1874D|nr:sigma-54 dependent transcriptional regulator [Aliiroseovarius sp. S2029]MCK8482757.1 sigma-54 dependent transcriptional regulator [Aliiroseovarius sp. S2029]